MTEQPSNSPDLYPESGSVTQLADFRERKRAEAHQQEEIARQKISWARLLPDAIANQHSAAKAFLDAFGKKNPIVLAIIVAAEIEKFHTYHTPGESISMVDMKVSEDDIEELRSESLDDLAKRLVAFNKDPYFDTSQSVALSAIFKEKYLIALDDWEQAIADQADLSIEENHHE